MDDRSPLTLDQVFERLADPRTLAASVESVEDAFGADAEAWDELGRLAFVGGPFSVQQVSERFDGASRAVREFPGASLSVLRGDDRSMNAGFAAGVELATRGDLPDGVFAVNDLVGLGVVRGLTSFGVDIPRDVAVIGFDGDDIAAVAGIPLSTISTPGDTIGETAYELLLQELGEPLRAFDSRQQVVAPELIVRASTVGTSEQAGDAGDTRAAQASSL